MNSSFHIAFFIRKNRLDKRGQAPIFLRITVDGRRIDCSVSRKVAPANWDPSYGRVRESNRRLKELNRYLDELRARVYSIQGFYRNEGIPYTAKIIRDKLLGINKNHRTLLALYQ